jgi:hypothetical protein
MGLFFKNQTQMKQDQLTQTCQDYISENWPYQTSGSLARALNIPEFQVKTFCYQRGFKTPTQNRKKPEVKTNEGFFDSDTYMKSFLY